MTKLLDVDVLCDSCSSVIRPINTFSLLQEQLSTQTCSRFIRRFKIPTDQGYIQLNNERTEARCLKNYSDKDCSNLFVFGESDFSKIKTPVSFELYAHCIEGDYWNMVGVGIEKIIGQEKPVWRHNSDKHGAYLLGDTYWLGVHDNKDLNDKNGFFNFDVTGHRIKITYDPATKDCLFECDVDTPKAKQFTIRNVPREARPCGFMCFVGSVLSIQ
jgi:hypothetical protein